MIFLKKKRIFWLTLLSFTVMFAFLFVFSSMNRISIDAVKDSGFPVLCIDTFMGKKIAGKTDYVECRFQDGNSVQAGKIRGHGNTTWRTRELYKKSYLLKFDRPYGILGLPDSRKWVLISNNADKTRFRNRFAFILSKKIFDRELWVPERRYAFLFLNGKFNGFYEVAEKIEAVPGSVLSEDGGSFLSVVNSRQNKEFNFVTERGVSFSIRSKGRTAAEYGLMKDKIQAAEERLFSDSFRDSFSGWRRVLDETTFIDWYLTNEFTKNRDASFSSSCFMFYDAPKDKFFMGPSWDFDISCGNISWGDCDNPEGFHVMKGLWYERLFQDEEFMKAVSARWKERRNLLFDLISDIDALSSGISEAVGFDEKAWPSFGKRKWPHPPAWKTRKRFDDEIGYMKEFLLRRYEWLDGQFGENNG